MAPPPHAPPGPRFYLYSHDSFGLGHLRRCLTLAAELVASLKGAECLVVSGSPRASFFDPAPGVDVLKLPSIGKDAGGTYRPRQLRSELSSVLELRRHLLLESFRAFRPDLLLVDHQVVGLHGEALPLLRRARDQGAKTVLGIRDVVDAPEVVAREWGTDECRWALSEGYDRVCVYGTPAVFDARVEYPIPPELRERIEFVGYVAQPGPSGPGSTRTDPAELVVTMGGGEDACDRLDLVLDALALGGPPRRTALVAGPLLEEERFRHLRRRARNLKATRVYRAYRDIPSLLRDARAVVAMAGYNTAVEILQSGTPAVLLPRTRPRREQAIRAERLEALGLAHSLVDPSAAQLRAAIEACFRSRPAKGSPPDLLGRQRMGGLAAELLGFRIPSPAPLEGRSLVS